MTDRIDVVIIGAGVVGLAAARTFAKAGREVLIVEREPAIGLHTSSRNSEVVHAGIYYEPGSLKARLCLEGKSLLYDYCARTGVGFKKTGKLIVAQSPAEVGKLKALQQNASACGVHDLVWLDGPEAMRLEPELRCVAALLSPSTGTVDSGQLMLTLQGDAEATGAMIAFQSEVTAGEISEDGVLLSIKSMDGSNSEILARLVINSAGHGAHALAGAIKGYDRSMLPPQYFAKGSYCSVSGRSPFAHHIYPIPVAGGLGTHVTNDMGGSAKLGPDVTWIPKLNYDVDQHIADKFKTACEGFWPGIRDREVTPAYCGVRPKISGPGEPNADFRIQPVAENGTTVMINLFGIESPGLTSSLAIAEYLLRHH
jgi:L-2-hydroxyglutarate oxidase LhgO